MSKLKFEWLTKPFIFCIKKRRYLASRVVQCIWLLLSCKFCQQRLWTHADYSSGENFRKNCLLCNSNVDPRSKIGRDHKLFNCEPKYGQCQVRILYKLPKIQYSSYNLNHILIICGSLFYTAKATSP